MSGSRYWEDVRKDVTHACLILCVPVTTAGRRWASQRDFWSGAVQLLLLRFDALIINDHKCWYGGWLPQDYFLMYHIEEKAADQ